jgi:hypothetical protein
LFVQDVVTSRLFLGGGPYKPTANTNRGIGAPVYMSLTALDFSGDQRWTCVFRTKDTTEQVMDLVVSNDGNHLFVLTKKVYSAEYAIYRVSGFDQYRDFEEIDVAKRLYTADPAHTPVQDDNDKRMLIDDTLVSGIAADILSIALDPQNNDHLIYTTNYTGGVSSKDYSRIQLITNALTATFSTVNIEYKEGTGLPGDMPVYTSLIEMTNSNTAYIGTEKGIYMTENLTAPNPKWNLHNKGIDINVPVFQLYQQTKNIPSTYSITYTGGGSVDKTNFPGVSNYGIIYAATYGAGIFRDTTHWQPTAIANYPSNKAAQETLKVYPNPTNSSVTIDYMSLSSNDRVQLNVFDITGKIILTKNLGVKEAGSHSERLDCSNLPNGFYFVNMIIGQYNKTAKIIISK